MRNGVECEELVTIAHNLNEATTLEMEKAKLKPGESLRMKKVDWNVQA